MMMKQAMSGKAVGSARSTKLVGARSPLSLRRPTARPSSEGTSSSVKTNGLYQQPPLVGNLAPDFSTTAVYDQEFMDITLKQYKGQYVVLFFYPLDFTFVCPTEITAFSDRHDEFKELGAQVLGVSVDSQFSHLAWIQTPRNEGGVGDLKYPLVSDFKKDMASKYGVLSDDGVALRGLFIIDKEGVIQHSTINNLGFGRSVEETKRVLQAIQYIQNNPDEVCPAGWKPGDQTMKPGEAKDYFAKL